MIMEVPPVSVFIFYSRKEVREDCLPELPGCEYIWRLETSVSSLNISKLSMAPSCLTYLGHRNDFSKKN
jgi:hypothetical protein